MRGQIAGMRNVFKGYARGRWPFCAYRPGVSGESNKARPRPEAENAMSATTELLTVEEMAERLRVRPDTIRVWSRRSLIPAVRINAKIIRYDASEVIEALRSGGDSKR